MIPVSDIRIPPLRQDLKVYKSQSDADGAPNWMLYDPLADNYFKIGWFEFECLRRFPEFMSASQLVHAINNETTLDAGLDDVKEFIGFLAMNGLLLAHTKEVQKILQDVEKDRKPSFFMKLFSTYLFIRVPLFNPDGFLKTVYPYIKFMFTRPFLAVVMCLLVLGIFLTVQRWDEFAHTFTSFFSFQGVMLVIIATLIIKCVHEFGHAFMAHKYGVPVTTMGVILIVLYPILYTETTNAWKLYDRRKRLHIGAAGLMSEMTLASVALVMWHISDPGLFQNIMYFVAFLSFTISIFVNLNPLMKFDGYYLLMDLIGIDNLQAKSTYFFKWKMRYILLGLKDDPPMMVGPKEERFLSWFGLALAIYRMLIFIGIGALIYLFFFKPLGFIIMCVALAVLLGVPIVKELMVWYKERKRIWQNLVPRVLLAIIAGVIVLAFLPIQNEIKVPAVLHVENYTELYAPMPARIEAIHVENGQRVQAGDIMFELASDKLMKAIEDARLTLQLYQQVKDREQTIDYSSEKETTLEELSVDDLILEERTRLEGLVRQRNQLTVTAPFAGVASDIDREIHQGRWVNQDVLLARILNNDSASVTAYAPTEVYDRLMIPAKGAFKSDNKLLSSVAVTLTSVSELDTKNILYPELSSLYGGSIPADDVDGETISRRPLYVLRLQVDTMPAHLPTTEKGTVLLEVEAASFAGRAAERLTSLIIRETGL